MKRSLVLVMTSILVVCLIAGCGGGVEENGVEENGVEAYFNPDKTISTGVNKEFTIAVNSNPTTGFQWEVSYDERMLELVEQTYKAGEQAGGGIRVGAGGVDYFRFKALRPGKTKSTFIHKRPWEITINEQRVFHINIE